MKTIIIFIFLVISLPSIAQDKWVYFSTTEEGDFYYDSESIMENTSDKTITRVWYKRTGVLYHKIYKKNVEHSLTLIDFYCGKRKCKYVEAVFYFTDGSYETYTFGDFLDHIVPDTAIEELYNTMCKNY